MNLWELLAAHIWQVRTLLNLFQAFHTCTAAPESAVSAGEQKMLRADLRDEDAWTTRQDAAGFRQITISIW